MVGHHRISLRRACRLVKLRRSVHYYRSVKDPKLELRRRMHELAQVRIRYGYRRIHVLLRREVVVQRNQRAAPSAANDA